MKAVVIGEPSGASKDAIMAVYPRHKAVVDTFIARGVVLGIGPFTDGATWPSSKRERKQRPFPGKTHSFSKEW